jgi:anti-anti-sigma factor
MDWPGGCVARWVNVVWGGSAEADDLNRGLSIRRTVERAALAWFAVVWVVDMLTPHLVFIGLVSLSTLLIAAVSTVRRTAAYAIAAFVLSAASPLWDTVATSTAVIRDINTVLVGLVALAIALLRQGHDRQMQRLLAAAETAQRAVLPTLPHRAGPVIVAARYHSATEQAMLGGDVFDMFWTDDGTVIALVGDVCGKGLSSVQEGARLIRAFRQYAPTSTTLVELATRIDTYLRQFLAADMFITALLADVSDPNRFTVVSCGHPAPLLVTATRMIEVPVHPGPPLGLGVPTCSSSHPWRQGDRLLLHTDGLFEARNGSGTFLSVADVEPALRLPSVDDAVDAAVSAVETWVPRGRLTDDVCLLVLENAGPVRSADVDEIATRVVSDPTLTEVPVDLPAQGGGPPESAPGSPFEITLAGELDPARHAELTRLADDFEASSLRSVRIDMTQVTFVDSSGVSFLIHLERAASSREGVVEIVGASPWVRRMLRLVNLEDRFVVDNAIRDDRSREADQ